MYMTLIAATLLVASDVTTRPELLAYLTSATGSFESIQADFAATSLQLDAHSEKTIARNSGTFRFRRDGRTWMKVESEKDGQTQSLELGAGQRIQTMLAGGTGTIERDMLWASAESGRPGAFMALYMLRTFWFDHLKNSACNFRNAQRDGRKCLVFDYDCSPLARSEVRSPPFKLNSTVWLDLERGGHVVYVETRSPTGLESRTYWELTKHSSGLWLPWRRIQESFGVRTRDPNGKPRFRTTTELRLESIRLNSELGDAAFAVNFPNGTYVNNIMTGKSYWVGGEPKRTKPIDRAKELEKVLESAPPPKAEYADPKSGWINAALIAVALACGVGAVLIWRARATA